MARRSTATGRGEKPKAGKADARPKPSKIDAKSKAVKKTAPKQRAKKAPHYKAEGEEVKLLALRKEVESVEKKISSKKKTKETVSESDEVTGTKSRRSSRLNPSHQPPSNERVEMGVKVQKVQKVQRRQVERMKEKVGGRKEVVRTPARKRKAEEKENFKEVLLNLHLHFHLQSNLHLH